MQMSRMNHPRVPGKKDLKKTKVTLFGSRWSCYEFVSVNKNLQYSTLHIVY